MEVRRVAWEFPQQQCNTKAGKCPAAGAALGQSQVRYWEWWRQGTASDIGEQRIKVKITAVMMKVEKAKLTSPVNVKQTVVYWDMPK
jgi:hypothetical protein